MKVTLHSTSAMTMIGDTKARIWEGETENGIKCFAAIAVIGHHKDDDHRNEEFTQSLMEVEPPSERAIQAFDARYIL